MEKKDVNELTDQELIAESKQASLSPIVNALFIGFLCGILVFSFAKNTWGFLSLIPLWLIYKLVQGSKRKEQIDALLKERNIK